MLSRRSMVAACAVLLGVAAFGFTSHAGPGSTACIFGDTHGDWQTPTLVTQGYAKGLLYTTSGTLMFKMDAKLTLGPATSATQKSGYVKGYLWAVNSPTPSSQPYAYVLGKWVGDSTGHGKFSASIYKLPTTTPVPAPIGQISGEFYDPPISTTPYDPVGKYKGTWHMCF
ncbi:MAG: hypothetical protein HY812_09815 [Planctomycetes bacterium]|nr:hypothetical protein [Planctomycetota bacterium]